LGEAAAISLAQELKAELLMDDMKARKIAAGLGLKTVGLLGLLRAAASRDLIDLIPMLDRLETTSFFAPRDLLEAMRAEARRRHNG
jgi:predicted nucleic acid-binding protein